MPKPLLLLCRDTHTYLFSFRFLYSISSYNPVSQTPLSLQAENLPSLLLFLARIPFLPDMPAPWKASCFPASGFQSAALSPRHLADAALHIHSFVACHCQKSFSVNLSDFRIADGFHHTVDCCLHRSLIQFSLCLADTDFRITDIQLKFLDFFFFFGDRLFEFRYGINAITRFKRIITRIVWLIRIVRFIRIIVLRILCLLYTSPSPRD